MRQISGTLALGIPNLFGNEIWPRVARTGMPPFTVMSRWPHTHQCPPPELECLPFTPSYSSGESNGLGTEMHSPFSYFRKSVSVAPESLDRTSVLDVTSTTPFIWEQWFQASLARRTLWRPTSTAPWGPGQLAVTRRCPAPVHLNITSPFTVYLQYYVTGWSCLQECPQ